jgi:hypothetical protein
VEAEVAVFEGVDKTDEASGTEDESEHGRLLWVDAEGGVEVEGRMRQEC